MVASSCWATGMVPFQAIPLTTLGLPPVSAAVGDFERNGKPDVAVVASSQSGAPTSNLYILQNDGSGALSLVHTYSLPAPGFHILVGDLNADGNLDLVVIEGGYSVLLGNGDGSFQSPVFYPQNPGFVVATLVDVNNDQKLDLVEAYPSVGVALGMGTGRLRLPFIQRLDVGRKFDHGTLRGDGKVDIGVLMPYLGRPRRHGNALWQRRRSFDAVIVPTDYSFTPAKTADSGTSAERTCSVATNGR